MPHRSWIVIALLLALSFATWQWLRPYDGKQPANAVQQIQHADLRCDHSDFWVVITLKQRDASQPLPQSCWWVNAQGERLRPTDMRRLNDAGTWELRFWLSAEQLHAAAHLEIDGEILRVKASGLARMEHGSSRQFQHLNW